MEEVEGGNGKANLSALYNTEIKVLFEFLVYLPILIFRNVGQQNYENFVRKNSTFQKNGFNHL